MVYSTTWRLAFSHRPRPSRACLSPRLSCSSAVGVQLLDYGVDSPSASLSELERKPPSESELERKPPSESELEMQQAGDIHGLCSRSRSEPVELGATR